MAKIFNFRVERARQLINRGAAEPEMLGMTIIEEMADNRLPWQLAARYGHDVTAPAGAAEARNLYSLRSQPDDVA